MDNDNKKGFGAVVIFAVLHLLCCGIPLIILSGVSLAFVRPTRPFIGSVLAIIGMAGFIWYLKRGCAICPRNEGRCSLEARRVREGR